METQLLLDEERTKRIHIETELDRFKLILYDFFLKSENLINKTVDTPIIPDYLQQSTKSSYKKCMDLYLSYCKENSLNHSLVNSMKGFIESITVRTAARKY
jgi:hypothetical protein